MCECHVQFPKMPWQPPPPSRDSRLGGRAIEYVVVTSKNFRAFIPSGVHSGQKWLVATIIICFIPLILERKYTNYKNWTNFWRSNKP